MPSDYKYLLNSLSPNAILALNEILSDIAGGKSAHAYIFEGGNSKMRLLCAKICAAAINCSNLSSNRYPCIECSSCRKIMEGSFLDVEQISTDAQSLKVDEIRSIRSDAYVVPQESDFHIYIIEDGGKMTTQAQNALLKVLEEPPCGVLFFILVSTKASLLPTVISRSMVYSLGQVSLEDCRKLFTSEKKLDRIAAERAAKLIHAFEKTDFSSKNIAESAQTLSSCAEKCQKFYHGELDITEMISKDKEQTLLNIKVLALGARDILISKKTSSAQFYVFDTAEDSIRASERISSKKAAALFDLFSDAAKRLEASGNLNAVSVALMKNAFN